MNPSTRQHDISQINEFLFISAWPRGEHNDQIRALDIRLILSMHWQRPSQTLDIRRCDCCGFLRSTLP